MFSKDAASPIELLQQFVPFLGHCSFELKNSSSNWKCSQCNPVQYIIPLTIQTVTRIIFCRSWMQITLHTEHTLHISSTWSLQMQNLSWGYQVAIKGEKKKNQLHFHFGLWMKWWSQHYDPVFNAINSKDNNLTRSVFFFVFVALWAPLEFDRILKNYLGDALGPHVKLKYSLLLNL